MLYDFMFHVISVRKGLFEERAEEIKKQIFLQRNLITTE